MRPAPPTGNFLCVSLEADYSIVGEHQVGQIISSSELSARGCQILLGDLTGPRTRNSDVDRDLGPDDLVE
jgi:hypothetical protein